MIRDNKQMYLVPHDAVAVCEKVQGVGVIGANQPWICDTYIGSAFDMGSWQRPAAYPVDSVSQYVRPVHLYEKDNTEEVFAAIADPEKYVVVQTCTVLSVQRLGEAVWLCRSAPM